MLVARILWDQLARKRLRQDRSSKCLHSHLYGGERLTQSLPFCKNCGDLVDCLLLVADRRYGNGDSSELRPGDTDLAGRGLQSLLDLTPTRAGGHICSDPLGQDPVSINDDADQLVRMKYSNSVR